MALKAHLRKHFREIRRHISMEYRQYAANAAVKHLIKLPLFNQSKRIACYLSIKDEFDASLIIKTIWQAHKECYLPALTEKENRLMFVRYHEGDALCPNRYSILEPANLSQVVTPENLDIVITPLVAFDSQGHRLGVGGGYYDRTFSFLQLSAHKKPFFMGLAYAEQQADLLPSDPWDIALNGAITEKAYVPCHERSRSSR